MFTNKRKYFHLQNEKCSLTEGKMFTYKRKNVHLQKKIIMLAFLAE